MNKYLILEAWCIRGIYSPPPSKHAPDEIRNGMFLLMVKKGYMGGKGGRCQDYRYLSAPSCVLMPQRQIFFGPDKNYSAPPLKRESAPEHKKMVDTPLQAL